jgi:mono/diheme cytochrome c family protein
MPFVTRRSLFVLALLGFAGAVAVAGAVWSGLYDVGADAAHSRPVFLALQTVRERSIAVRAADLVAPDLDDDVRIRHGAGNYAAMCVACHAAPGGGGDAELMRGLYPAPPDLTREAVDPRVAFWTIKHGIKGSGMPAWGKGMDDASMWNLVAFLQRLPRLDAAGYAALVAASGGHAHGTGEDGAATHDHAAPAVSAAVAEPATPKTTTHLHADGKAHVHAADPPPRAAGTPRTDTAPPEPAELPPGPEAGAEADDGHRDHDHEH